MNDVIQRLDTALAGRYRIERELGQGGMATVYLAQDLRHDRKVALKVLKPELAAVLGAERFVVEIKTTAQLQHPHILPLFDSGTADGFLFYVMPFIQGETLRAKLDRETQLGVEEAVRIASEVADALDYAHSQGVIHRDVKPENILLANGRPMVADFGIALAVSAAAGGRMTETGLSLGTPHYMSPEQATADKELTGRSDIYSLASVLYEMLTGDPPHTGASAQQIIMKIVTEEPDPVTDRRKTVPANVSAALVKGLQKLPADRFATARGFAEALANPGFSAPGLTRVTGANQTGGWRRYAGVIIVALATVAVGATVAALQRGASRASSAVNRLSLALPAAEGLVNSPGGRLAWAPDGRSFVYVGPGTSGTQLWLRSLDGLQASPIRGTDGASSPFFSPDGTRIGFVVLNPFSVWTVPTTGGVAERVAQSEVSGGGGNWASDGYIYFDGASSVSRSRPDGTGRESVYALDLKQGEIGVAWPEALPNGRGVLFRLRSAGEDLPDYRIMVVDGRTKQVKMLTRGTLARYSPTGHLLWATADGMLMGSRFDLDRLELVGSPVTLIRGLGLGAFGSVDLALSSSGDLLYATGNSATGTEPTWVGRDGGARPVDPRWPGGQVFGIALSPDGSRLALVMTSATANSTPDLWVKQLDTGPLSRLTFRGAQNRGMIPSWSADGHDILYASDTSGAAALYRQRADGSTPARLVVSSPAGISSGLESPDGRWLLLESGECCDILGMRPGVDSMPIPLLATTARERSPTLSPDGRWMAYLSDETGLPEVYVRPFPDVQSGKWQVSTDQGLAVRWSRRGDELFYIDAALNLVAAKVAAQPTFEITNRETLFPAAGYSPAAWGQAYDVAPDGKRFLMLRSSPADGAPPPSLVLVQGFVSELQAKIP